MGLKGLRVEIYDESSSNFTTTQLFDGIGHFGEREDFVDGFELALVILDPEHSR